MNTLTELIPSAIPVGTKDGTVRKGRFVVVAGKSDAGKTYFIASAPGPVIIVELDDGTDAIGTQYDEATDEEYAGIFPDTEILTIPITGDTPAKVNSKDKKKIEKLKKDGIEFTYELIYQLDKTDEALSEIEEGLKNGAKVGTVALETISWIWMGAMDYMKYEVLSLDHNNKAYVEEGWDWGIAQKRYGSIFRKLKRLRRFGCHVILSVHTKDIMDKNHKVTGEKLHWWPQSIKMTDVILWLHEKKKANPKTKEIDILRECEFYRFRTVKHGKKLAKTLIDVTWDDFIQETSRIRKESAKVDKAKKDRKSKKEPEAESKYVTKSDKTDGKEEEVRPRTRTRVRQKVHE